MRRTIIKTLSLLIKRVSLSNLQFWLATRIYKGNIQVGEYSYGKPNVVDFGGKHRVIIGKFCSIAPKVSFLLTLSHNTKLISTYPFRSFFPDWKHIHQSKSHVVEKGDIIVGNDVWIGYGATILPGLKIGDGAIIASMSVVTKDVDPYTIVGGNPAKLIKKRFNSITVKKLMKIKWWDWPIRVIQKNVGLIANDDLSVLKKMSNS